MSKVFTQDDQGRWMPAEPIGWQEEHNLLQRFVLWILRRPHCCNEEASA